MVNPEVIAKRLARAREYHSFLNKYHALKDQFVQMIGFRNVLVHEYVMVDKATVHRVLTTELTIVEKIIAAYARFL